MPSPTDDETSTRSTSCAASVALSQKPVRRVKTGCITCRIRRVKCDENKPACLRCCSTGRKCDGYTSLPFSRKDLQAASRTSSATESSSGRSARAELAPIARMVCDPAFTGVLEKRYFQFFRHKTVASTNRLMNSRFWDRIVLQICHVEPAVKHAILALSSLHQLSEVRQHTDLALRHQKYAEQHYQHALVAAQKLLDSSTPEDIDRILIACLVLTCYDNVRGNYLASQMHTGSGRAILAQHHERLRSLSRRNDLNEIQQLFARLDITAMAFSVENARYPYDIASFHATRPNLVPDAFDSADGARAVLLDHVRWVMICHQSTFDAILQDSLVVPMLDMERRKAQSHLERWSQRFEEVVSCDLKASPILVKTLRVWHQLTTIDLAAGAYGSELRFDMFIDQYERAVTTAEEVIDLLVQQSADSTFSYDLGISIPLFEIVQRCREAHIRRRALRAMRAGPKQEGSWGSPGSADAIEQWMLFEESGLGAVETAADVPEWRRIINMEATVNAELGMAELVFDVTPSEGHERELKLGFLGTSRSGDGQTTSAAVKPLSMGAGHTMSYRARSGVRLAKVLAYNGDSSVMAWPAQYSSFRDDKRCAG